MKPHAIIHHTVEAPTPEEEMLLEGEVLEAETKQYSSDPEVWLPEFYLRKEAEITALEKKIREQSKLMLSALKSRRNGLAWKFGSLFEDIVRRQLVDQGGKKKSITFFSGRAGYRSKKATVQVTDEEALIQWFRLQPEAIRLELEKCFDIKFARKTPLTEYVLGSGDIPDGVEFVDAHESFYPDIKHPELPPTEE